MTHNMTVKWLKWIQNMFDNDSEQYRALDVAIKLVEEEPTTKNDLGVDCISKQAVLDLIADYDLSMGQVVRGIHALPSVTPQEPRWIPVSEKLPKIQNYTDNYLVTLKRGGVHIAMFTECDGKSWWTYGDVIAWMPLPLPWKGE